MFFSDTKKTLDYYLCSHRHGKSEAQGWCWLWNWQNNIFNALQASSELALSEKVSSSHLPWTNNCIRCYLCQFFSQFSSCIVIFICFHPFFMFFILSWIYRWKYLRILVSSLRELQWFNEIHFATLAEQILGRLLNFRESRECSWGYWFWWLNWSVVGCICLLGHTKIGIELKFYLQIN